MSFVIKAHDNDNNRRESYGKGVVRDASQKLKKKEIDTGMKTKVLRFFTQTFSL